MSLSEDAASASSRASRRRADCDRLAELSGLFHSAGRLHLRGRGEVSLHLDVSESAVARRAFRLLRERRRRLGDPHVPAARLRRGDAVPAARRGRRGGAARPARGGRRSTRAARRSSDRRAASFGGRAAGARTCAARCSAADRVSGPRSPHLEIRATGVAGAEFLADLARRDGLSLQRARPRPSRRRVCQGRRRRSRTCSRPQVRATPSSSFEERAVVGATRARANRLANADHANLVRTARAAHRQAQAVRRLAADGRLETLPPRLREAADLRLRHPSLSLRELAGECRPPVTKAAFHQRLARIVELSDIVNCNQRRYDFRRCCREAPLLSILSSGGSALVRWRIQTPSVIAVLSAANRRGRSSSELPLRPALLGSCAPRDASY